MFFSAVVKLIVGTLVLMATASKDTLYTILRRLVWTHAHL